MFEKSQHFLCETMASLIGVCGEDLSIGEGS